MTNHQKVPNEKLRYQRELRGWSQKKVADLINTSKEVVSIWECGERLPGKKFQEKLCLLFEKSAEELGFIGESDITSLPSSPTTDQAVIATLSQQHNIQSLLPLFSQAVSHGIIEAARELGEQDLNRLRRQLLQQALSTAITPYAFSSPDIVERLVRAIKRSTSIDSALLAHLEMITRNNRQLFVRSQKSALMLPDISRHLDTITQLLEHSLPMPIHTLLCTFAAETTQLIGDILFNAGDNDSAEKYYNAALDASREAANEVLYAVVLGRKSFISIYNGNPQTALPLLKEAHDIVNGKASDVIDAWLWAVEAEVHANSGNSDACLRALEQSEIFIERDQQGEVSYTFADISYSPFTSSHLLGYKGVCNLKLHMTSNAQEYLEKRLSSLEENFSHKKSIALVDLATVYVQRGEIEEACKYVRQALDIITQTKSARVFQRVLQHRRHLKPWEKISSVQNLDRHIDTVLPYTKVQGGI
jgi:tetratricopeptide (TPR) repeat protein